MAVSSLPQRVRPSRVALHARISTSDQTTESQLLDLRRYVQDRGWQVFQEYTDNGISGTKDNRPALNRLVDDARKRRFDVVLVWRFDRFARSTKHLILALEEFRNLGIDFVSYQENIDTSSPLGGAIFTIISAVAQLERASGGPENAASSWEGLVCRWTPPELPLYVLRGAPGLRCLKSWG